MTTQHIDNIAIIWRNIPTELSLSPGISYTVQNVTPYPLEMMISESTPSENDKGHCLYINEPWVVKIDSTYGLYIRNQKEDPLKLGRISVTENSLIAGPYTNTFGTSVQYPLATDSDSAYVKDINLERSDNGDFTGSVLDYFNSLTSVNTNLTSDNPKSIKIWFERTIYAHDIGIGCDDISKGFGTDVTVKLLGSGEAVRFTKNFTSLDPNSALLEFGPKAFNGVVLEFNNGSEVCLSNITIRKAQETSATLQGSTPDGIIKNVNVTEDGDLAISDNSSGLSIAEGKVTGKTFIHKFGTALDFDKGDGEVDVWDGAEDGEPYEAMTYTFSTIADIDRISAEDNADTQDIEIQGLDTNWELITQTVTLTGQTPAIIPVPLIRVFRMKNDNSADLAGHVFCFVNSSTSSGVPDDPTKLRAVIHPDAQQTEMAIYTIPAGKTGYIRDWYASSAGGNKDTNIIIRLKTRNFGKVFNLKHRMSWAGTIPYQHFYTEPEGPFPEKTDIKMTTEVTAVGVTGAAVSAGFDIVLVDD